jgi:hypothetical protein
MRTLPREELETILEEDGFVEMDCQFCHGKSTASTPSTSSSPCGPSRKPEDGEADAPH